MRVSRDDAEHYYRAMYCGSDASWNLRDTHMFETLQSLLAFYGPMSRGIVWERKSIRPSHVDSFERVFHDSELQYPVHEGRGCGSRAPDYGAGIVSGPTSASS